MPPPSYLDDLDVTREEYRVTHGYLVINAHRVEKILQALQSGAQDARVIYDVVEPHLEYYVFFELYASKLNSCVTYFEN